LTQIERRCVERFLADAGPEIEVITRRPALETLKGILGQVGQKQPAIRFEAMQGTGTANVLAVSQLSQSTADQ
jgi:hypothetical protein